uniref:Dopamine receptor D2 n=1 Tax=Laticauda laticaudata TaxID=8630 RepID=A0A8C5S0N0_LATLA
MDFPNISWYNDSYENRTLNGSSLEQKPTHYNYYAMLLTLLIFVIVFGNVLVCMAVSKEKALQTTTNYLIVSLAVADLLVATLVMPWVVYMEVVGEWRFSRIHCDIFVTLDVMMCTASILNLCAISIDRYTAVAMPMLYNTRYSSKRRVTGMIAVVWILSFAISCPLLFGLNNTEKNECIIANPAFVVYSSIVSFYVPFIVTLLVYVQIYIVLRKRRKRVNTKRISSHVGLDADTQAPLKEAMDHMEEMEMATSTSPPKNNVQPPLPSDMEPAEPAASIPCANLTPPSPENRLDVQKNGHTTDNSKTAKVFEIQTMPNGKTRTSLKTMSRRKFSQQKEKKATQMLAIVLGVFIICWLPFFITHIMNMHCNCEIPQVMYNAFTWLGYVNSAVNPIIYTTFNIEFRKAFMKILHC